MEKRQTAMMEIMPLIVIKVSQNLIKKRNWLPGNYHGPTVVICPTPQSKKNKKVFLGCVTIIYSNLEKCANFMGYLRLYERYRLGIWSVGRHGCPSWNKCL